MNINPEKNGGNQEAFDQEERYDRELMPLISEVCDKAQELGVPIFVIACYKADSKGGSWLASSARAREGFVPREFYIIRAVVEGHMDIIKL